MKRNFEIIKLKFFCKVDFCLTGWNEIEISEICGTILLTEFNRMVGLGWCMSFETGFTGSMLNQVIFHDAWTSLIYNLSFNCMRGNLINAIS